MATVRSIFYSAIDGDRLTIGTEDTVDWDPKAKGQLQ
jgi:hypothetical protein